MDDSFTVLNRFMGVFGPLVAPGVFACRIFGPKWSPKIFRNCKNIGQFVEHHFVDFGVDFGTILREDEPKKDIKSLQVPKNNIHEKM